MRAILGLGNPDFKYKNTRHNVGFTILDIFAHKHKLKESPGKGDFFFIQSSLFNSPFILAKPVTYMNRSGIAAQQICDQFEIPVENLLVVVDDIHIPEGKIRLRKSGGDGGHNGIKSIIYHLESNNFPRLRFGIGKDFDEGLQADYVLSKFSEESFSAIQSSLELAVLLIEEFISGGTQSMLNQFSKSSKKTIPDMNKDVD